MDVFDLFAKISLDISEFEKGLNNAKQKAEGFTSNLKGISSNIDKAYSGMGDLLEPAVDGFKAVEGVGKKAGNAITTGLKGFAAAATAVAGFGTAAVKSGMSFDATMSQVSAISGATGEDFDALRDKALEMGAKTKFSASEAAEAMTYMGMAGWKTEDMLDGIAGIMNLAAASGEDLATTSDIVTDALTAFGLQAGDSGHFADVLAKAASSANTNVGMMGESFKYAAPLAGAMKYSIEDVSIAIGLMANSGIKASQAGTSFRSAISHMLKPTDPTIGAMKQLGLWTDDTNVAFENADGSAKTLGETMGILRNAFSGLTETEQTHYAAQIFGVEAMSGMLAIINASTEDYEKLTAAIYECDGAAEQMAATMIDNLQGDLTLLGSAFESLQIAISDSLTPTLREFAQFGQKAMASLLEGFQGGGVSGFMSALSGLVTDGVTMLAAKAPEFTEVSVQFISALAEGLIDSAPQVMDSADEIISTLTSGLSEFLGSHSTEMIEIGYNVIETIASGFADASDVITEHIGEFVPLIAEGFLTYHESLFTVGMDILGAIGQGIIENKDQIQSMASETITNMVTALRDNAPSIIEGGLALLEALVGAIKENLPLILETGAEIIGELVTGISTASPEVQAIIGTAVLPFITKIIDVVGDISGAVGKVVEFVTGDAGIGKVLSIGGKLLGGVQTLWGLLAANPIALVIAAVAALVAGFVLLWQNCEGFREFWIGLWEGLKEAVSSFGEWISEKVTGIIDAFKTAWDGIGEFFSEIWEGLKEVVSAFGEWIGEKMSEIVEWVKEKWTGIQEFFAGVWQGIQDVFQGVAEFFSEIFQAAAEAVQAAWEAVVEFFTGVWEGIQTIFSVVADVLGEFFSAAVEAVQAAWEGVVDFFTGVWEGIQTVFSVVAEVLGGFFQAAVEAIQSAWSAVVEFFSGVWEGIQAVFSVVEEVLGGFFKSAWEAAKEAWGEAKEHFAEIWENIRSKAEEAWENVKTTIGDTWDTVKEKWGDAKEFFLDLWTNIKEKGSEAADKVKTSFIDGWNNIKEKWDGAKEFFSGVVTKILAAFDKTPEEFKSIGKDMLEGLWSGIQDKVGWVKEKVGGVVDAIKKTFTGKDGFDEHSPSKWANRVFRYVMEGGADGLALGAPVLLRDMDSFVSRMKNGMEFGLAEGWDDEYSSIKRQIENGMNFGTASVGLTTSGGSYSPVGTALGNGGPAAGSNFTVNIYNPEKRDAVTEAQEWQKTSQRVALGLV